MGIYTLPKKTRSALRQQWRKGGEISDIDGFYSNLEKLIALCGDASKSTKMSRKIGSLLLEDDLHIIAPMCPDYGHKDGKYTFDNLGSGVSLLAQKHILFLKEVTELLPHTKVTLMFADLECEDAGLCDVVGLSPSDFAGRVSASQEATKAVIDSLSWNVVQMSQYISDIRLREASSSQYIAGEARFNGRIMSDTFDRADMYRRICPTMSEDDMKARTLRTASQYHALGLFAAEHGCAVCNHTTVNISWYSQTDTAVLHNPIAVY